GMPPSTGPIGPRRERVPHARIFSHWPILFFPIFRDFAMTDQYEKLAADLELYAAVCLRIRPKSGGLIPLRFNSTQRLLHEKLEDQLKRRGKVRALVLKGRQTGISTYTAARLFWKTTHRRGCRARILAHRLDASDTLFGIVQRFHEHLDPDLKPHT